MEFTGPLLSSAKTARFVPGSEEYLDSEKYQIRNWDLESPDSLAQLIAKVNQIRRENLALHGDWSLQFHPADNDQIIVYSKMTDDLLNIIVVVVNLDPYRTQSAWVDLPLDGVPPRPAPALSDARSADRRPLRLARAAKLRRTQSAALAGPHFLHSAAGADRKRRRLFCLKNRFPESGKRGEGNLPSPQDDALVQGRRSSTRSTSALFLTPTATASAISVAWPRNSITCRNWE